MKRTRIILLVALASLVAAVAASQADYKGADDTAATAFGPLKGDFSYAGKLNSGDDVDWFFFYVPSAGDHLRWSVTNTTPTSSCLPPGVNECNLYATLIDSSGKHQVGGDNSSAGTPNVPAGQTQPIDWTFTQPGKYYLLLQQDGDGPSYSFKVTPASGLSSSPPSGGSAGAKAMRLSAKGKGPAVRVGLVNPTRGSSVQAKLTLHGRTVGRLTLRKLPRGHVHFTVKLNRSGQGSLKRRHSLPLVLAVRLKLPDGTVQRGTRKVTVTG